MGISKIGQKSDGTIIGEDELGSLYIGTKRAVTYAELTRVVEGGLEQIKYGNQVIATGTTADPDGTTQLTNSYCDSTIEVVDWVAA